MENVLSLDLLGVLSFNILFLQLVELRPSFVGAYRLGMKIDLLQCTLTKVGVASTRDDMVVQRGRIATGA